MTVSLIVAHDINGVIGRDGMLPWHLPDDLARFRVLTLGHSVVMGRRTFESIGRPLPVRRNVVLTRDPRYIAHGAFMVSSMALALRVAAVGGGATFIIGGAETYAAALPFCDRAYITRVDTLITGENLTRFPCDLSRWRVDVEAIEHHAADARHAHAFAMMLAVRP